MEPTADLNSPDVYFTFLFFFFLLFSLSVGAELLSILDETENGFIWEHIQSYAEQAYGAWLGISVKGQAVRSHTHLFPPLSATEGKLTFKLSIQELFLWELLHPGF